MIYLEYFGDGLTDEEIQMAVRMADVKDPKSALLYALKVEAATQASCIDLHSIREARVTLDALSQLARHRPFHPTTKRYWALWDSLHLKNGVLYRKWESDDRKTFRWQLILPKTRDSTVLKELHGSPTGGHFGVMKTLQKVRPRKRTRGRLQLYNVGVPFERIAFDILGPFPRSSDDNNNILVVMDYFTKWPEAYPIPDQEASTVAEVLVQHWISRFGVPLQLHSDQGRNFDSAVCKRLCEILAIDKTRTRALHPQSDGMVEKSAVHETTSYSPSQMLFGRYLRLPADLLFSRPPDAPLAPEEYIEKLQAQMEEMHQLARERISMASEKMKTRYDARATEHDFREGDEVWLWNSKRRKGLSPKLQTNWEGPYTVLKRLNYVVVRIQKTPHSKPNVIHYNRLAPYLGQDEQDP
ncbi:retrovirus-related Pol polyprotein from transposon 412 [Trichonephila clavipes]|nr:retrovirus-related Pol polyprotein from transposon 412 [Trichonephila clavipes]